MPIRSLATHPAYYVTVAELAEYWAVGRQQIYKRIETGALEAIRLGPRLYRIRTAAAIEFEKRSSVPAGRAADGATLAVAPVRAAAAAPRGLRTTPLPSKIGLQRVRNPSRAD